jgi:hypothetical protein
VKSIVEYGSGIWGNLKVKAIDMVQNRAMRYFLGVHKFSPNLALSGDMVWLSPKLSRIICRIRLWNRLVNMQESRLTKKIFLWDMQICKKNWSKHIKDLFQSLNSQTTFENKGVYDLNEINETLKDIMLGEWKQEVLKKPKLRTYITFKENINTEDYVQSYMSHHARSLFAQFRHGILPIKIETGRFKNLKEEERICELCPLNVVENETHFLCECSLYTDARIKLFDKAIKKNPSFNDLEVSIKFNFLMKQMWRDVSKYLVLAWKVRQAHLYQ